jgi:hypothetical protein
MEKRFAKSGVFLEENVENAKPFFQSFSIGVAAPWSAEVDLSLENMENFNGGGIQTPMEN